MRIDSDEVSFTRTVKLGRKGARISAFRIGDKPSTATEMRRVLAEAGLRAGGYNIVKQGDVTNLATMTAYNRRKIIEDVAGVTAYDDEIRKSNTQRKHVENSIETIGILEDDQKNRLKSLSKEREQALKFKSCEKISTLLESFSINLGTGIDRKMLSYSERRELATWAR